MAQPRAAHRGHVAPSASDPAGMALRGCWERVCSEGGALERLEIRRKEVRAQGLGFSGSVCAVDVHLWVSMWTSSIDLESFCSRTVWVVPSLAADADGVHLRSSTQRSGRQHGQ
eukprot:3882806-Rhodomonas_salina.1